MLLQKSTDLGSTLLSEREYTKGSAEKGMKREKYTSTHLNFESRIQVDNREKYLLYQTLSYSTRENGTDLKFIENVL